MDHGRFRDGVHWVLGGKLSDKIGFTKSWFSVCSPAEYTFFIQYIHTFWDCAPECLSTVADMFRPAMFVSWHLFKTRESHQVIDFSSVSGEFRFRSGPAFRDHEYGLGLFWVDGSSCIISILILPYW
jgi:hypothetical protein